MKNKHWLTILIVALATVSFAACGGNNLEAASESSNNVDVSAPSLDTSSDGNSITTGEQGERPLLPQAALLPIGTLLLEDTDYAVNAEQAAELLPLWKAYRSLVESDIASSLEIDAVITQIENTMTSKQLQGITDMELAPENMREMMLDLGLVLNDAQIRDGSIEGATRPRRGLEGGLGGGPGGGPGGGLDGELIPDQIATLQAQREDMGGAQNRFSIIFVEALIELLETK